MRLLISIISFFTLAVNAQIPKLNTDTSSANVIFLDFDGAYVSGTSWNSGFTGGAPINAAASTLSNTQITETWKRVADEFSIFDLNITTDSVRFNSAAANRRMRVIITVTSSWFSPAGGVAYLNSFTATANNPAWVFENNLSYSPRYVADATAHEIGHTLNLYHQSVYNGSCVKTDEYNPGNGSGTTLRWAPIMGVAYYSNITTWYNGKNSTACGTFQYDIARILASTAITLKADDHGNTISSATNVPFIGTNANLSGIINDSADLDLFRMDIPVSTTLTVAANPVSPTSGVNFVNLDIQLEILDSLGNVLLTHDSASTPLAYINLYPVVPGRYYIRVDGVGSSNYGDYSSLGNYTLNITSGVSLPNTTITLKTINNSYENRIVWEQSLANISFFEIQYSPNGNEWTKEHIVGKHTNEYKARKEGYYRVIGYTSNGESYESNIGKVVKHSALTLNPNPAKEFFAITSKDNRTFHHVLIRDISGKLVYTGQGTTHQISHLSQGVYYVQVGTQVVKLVKE